MESQTALGRTLDLFERVSEWCGKLVSWLYAVLVLIIVYEVIARYVFNSPTKWVFDVSYMLGGAAFSIGAAWTLKVGRQVRVDIIYGRLAPRRRAIVDLVFGALFFFPLVIFAFIFSVDHAAFSWATRERIISGSWNPPIYPLKTAIPITYGLLLLQGIAEYAKAILRLREKEGV